MIDDEEKVLRIVALALAVWVMKAVPGTTECDTVSMAGTYLKFLKGESHGGEEKR